ncbi:MAG: DNA-binding protein [candidate division Zixibacteria bacterium CG_4_9_14_3_um_filter_46_8]|nr:MAG: DNA-binding protein [candidate division Zixibacteria bacterium CG_4_9_14_3_um_filter_46_8]
MTERSLQPIIRIETLILRFRDQNVLLDSDLAHLYDIETKQLKRAVRRNINRFPSDFMFQLTAEEFNNLRCQFGTSRWGGVRYLPYAFTEQGVAMLSSVLNSPRAIQVNIAIMRTFVKLRQIIYSHKEFEERLAKLEKKYGHHDQNFKIIFDAIRQLMEPPKIKKRSIGFQKG